MEAHTGGIKSADSQTQETKNGLPSDVIEIVPPKDEGWLVIKGKQETVVIGSGEELVVVTFKAATNSTLYVKTAVGKPICRFRHLTPEKQKELDPYIPEKLLKNKELFFQE